MRLTLPVAALVTLFSVLGIILGPSLTDGAANSDTPAPAPAACVLPHAVKASMPLIPPRLRVVR